MSEEQGTLNSFDPSDSSPDVSNFPEGYTTESLTDASEEPSAETKKTDQTPQATGKEQEGVTENTDDDQSKESKEEAEEKDEKPDTRYDKDPRFQKLIKTKNEQAEQLKGFERRESELLSRLDQLEAQLKQVATSSRPQVEEKDFDAEIVKLVNKLEEGEISQAQYELEKWKLGREREEAIQEAQVYEAQVQQEASKLKNEYLEAHPFVKELFKGRQAEIAAERRRFAINDDLSAALIVHIKDLESQVGNQEEIIQAAVEKATKEIETKIHADYKAKRTARSLGSAPAVPETLDEDAIMKDTSKFGGRTMALANLLKRHRSASA
jgi:hypothetical protein